MKWRSPFWLVDDDSAVLADDSNDFLRDPLTSLYIRESESKAISSVTLSVLLSLPARRAFEAFDNLGWMNFLDESWSPAEIISLFPLVASLTGGLSCKKFCLLALCESGLSRALVRRVGSCEMSPYSCLLWNICSIDNLLLDMLFMVVVETVFS